MIPDLEQSAILECAIQNNESDNVTVWVNWTRSDGNPLEKNSQLKIADVFFLVLYNITRDNMHEYICQLFSKYELEDQRTAAVMSTGQQSICKDYRRWFIMAVMTQKTKNKIS